MKIPVTLPLSLIFEFAAITVVGVFMPTPALAGLACGLIGLALVFALVT